MCQPPKTRLNVLLFWLATARACPLSNIDNEQRADAAYQRRGVGVPNVDLIGQTILINGFNGLKEPLGCNLTKSPSFFDTTW